MYTSVGCYIHCRYKTHRLNTQIELNLVFICIFFVCVYYSHRAIGEYILLICMQSHPCWLAVELEVNFHNGSCTCSNLLGFNHASETAKSRAIFIYITFSLVWALLHDWDVGHSGWLFKLYLHPRHEHCTDEAEKAETVLSAVIYFYTPTYHPLRPETCISHVKQTVKRDIKKKKKLWDYMWYTFFPSRMQNIVISVVVPSRFTRTLKLLNW